MKSHLFRIHFNFKTFLFLFLFPGHLTKINILGRVISKSKSIKQTINQSAKQKTKKLKRKKKREIWENKEKCAMKVLWKYWEIEINACINKSMAWEEMKEHNFVLQQYDNGNLIKIKKPSWLTSLSKEAQSLESLLINDSRSDKFEIYLQTCFCGIIGTLQSTSQISICY